MEDRFKAHEAQACQIQQRIPPPMSDILNGVNPSVVSVLTLPETPFFRIWDSYVTKVATLDGWILTTNLYELFSAYITMNDSYNDFNKTIRILNYSFSTFGIFFSTYYFNFGFEEPC